LNAKLKKMQQRDRTWRLLTLLLITAAAVVGGGFLIRNLRQYDIADLVSSIMAVSHTDLALAIAWAAASYVCLTGFDFLALRYVGHALPYKTVAFVSFVSLSIGHNVGLAFLSSGAIRLRYYSQAGLSVDEVARVIVFCGATVALGLATLAGIAILAKPDIAAEILDASTTVPFLVAAACLSPPIAYAVAAFAVRQPVRIKNFILVMPNWRIALAQILVGTTNFATVSACLHSAVSAFADISYISVTTVYVIANVAALISHVPGGLGVIEAVVLYLLSGVPLLGGVLVFRFVYFLLPLAVGGSLFALGEILLAGRRARADR